MPVTCTLDGGWSTPIRVERDDTGSAFELSPEQARALAADLEQLANDWEAKG